MPRTAPNGPTATTGWQVGLPICLSCHCHFAIEYRVFSFDRSLILLSRAGDPCDLQHPWFGIFGDKGGAPCENVQEIALSGNSLRGTLPEIFDQFDNLQRIAFDSLQAPTFVRNYLEGFIPVTLFQKNLLHLNLFNNLFKGDIPDEFVIASSLIDLDLGRNKLVSVRE